MSMPSYEFETAFDKHKAIAVLSYLTIIGWLIALLLHGQDKTPYVRFHLRQSLGLFVVSMLCAFIPLIGWLVTVTLMVAWAFAVYHAAIGHKISTPYIGDFFQQHLDFIH